MRLTFTIALIAAITAAAAPALACTPLPRCALVEMTGEVPCVELRLEEQGCYIEATLTCASNQAPDIWISSDPLATHSGQGYPIFLELDDTYNYRSLSWTLGDQSGVVDIYTKELPYEDDPCGGFLCAATPPQRPAAPLAALLPIILGALISRRRSR
jgi:hypothetical protein